jgi:hypothetical protein
MFYLVCVLYRLASFYLIFDVIGNGVSLSIHELIDIELVSWTGLRL